MPRGRPPLRIGEHGKIVRRQLRPGEWEAQCYFRDLDGIVRRPKRQTPRGEIDRHGAAAEAALREHLSQRGGHGTDEVSGSTLVSALLDMHMTALRKAERAPRTLDTYRLRVTNWNAVAGGLRVEDCTPGRLDRLLERVRDGHGDTTARQLRALVTAALDIAVRDGVLATNPVRALAPAPRPKRVRSGGATPIDASQIPAVVKALTESEVCRKKDLADPILMHLATGLRVSEILGLRWAEFDPEAATIAITGRVVRATGKGLLRTPTFDSSKGTAPMLGVPSFAVEMLVTRAQEPRPNKLGLIFPSEVGTLRDTSAFAKQWRSVRADLGEALEKSTGHSFRKTLGNLVTDATADPRKAADVLGHSDVRTTLKHYLQRRKIHHDVADLVDKAVRGGDSQGAQ